MSDSYTSIGGEINPEERKRMDEMVKGASWAATKGAVIGLAIGAVAGYGLYRTSALFRNISTPGKAFLWSSCGVAGFWIYGDTYMLENSRARREMKALEEAHAHKEPESEHPVLHWFREHRYEVIGGSWLASMAGSLAYSMRDRHLKMSQKLVHARVYAQFATVAVLLATAVAAQMDDAPKKKPQLEYRY